MSHSLDEYVCGAMFPPCGTAYEGADCPYDGRPPGL